jgi:hypothetical protein
MPFGEHHINQKVHFETVSVDLAQSMKSNMKKRPLNSVASPQMITGSVDR